MEIIAQIQERVLVLTLKGDLIGQESGMKLLALVNKEIISESIGDYVVDLSAIRYIDSSGIGVLLTIYNEVGNRVDGDFILINPSEQVIKLLNITKLNTVFSIVTNHQEAIEKLKG